MRRQLSLNFIAFSLPFVLFGCASLSPHDLIAKLPSGLRFHSVYRDVSALLDKGQLDTAREKLDLAGVGGEPRPDALQDRDAAAARKVFEERVTNKFLVEEKQFLDQGKPRAAADQLTVGLTICPWCVGIRQAKEQNTALLSSLDAFGAQLRQAIQAGGSDFKILSEYRELLSTSNQYRAALNDSPSIADDIRTIESRLAASWEARIQKNDFALSDTNRLHSDLALLHVSNKQQEGIESEWRLLSIEQGQLLRERQNRSTLITLAKDNVSSCLSPVSEICQKLAARLTARTMAALRSVLLTDEVQFTQIQFGEEMLAAFSTTPNGLDEMVALSHMRKARKTAGAGRSAILSLVHLARAQQLGLPPDPAFSQLRDIAAASFSASGRTIIHLRIQTNPRDDPTLQDIARFAVARSINAHARPHIYVQSVNQGDAIPEIEISIDSVQMHVPGIGDLRAVVSSYLSHYENVPNPQKRFLESQLLSQRISADYALSNLNSAIRMYNIDPTDWALANVNSARTTYSLAIDNYNYIVQQYNQTPSTISRPVFLPYTFKEGNVHHGWRLSGVVKVGNVKEQFFAEALDSDFVRLGTRRDDQDPERRRDNLLDIPVGTDRLVEQLTAASEKIFTSVAAACRALRIEVRSDLDESENRLISAALYPFSNTQAGSSEVWADRIIAQLTLPSISNRIAPPIRIVQPTNRLQEATPEQISKFYAPAVALVHSHDGATGSGALVSGDGLLLTAAHVLTSEPFAVTFASDTDNRRHPATVVFVDDTHDVALLRVSEFRSERWFSVSLSESASAGEPVVAMGFPAIGAAGPATSSISSGIIAKPFDPSHSTGAPEVVADVAVASGSSGGPLVSRKTGKIVGVVTAVISPSISKDFATSGFWALAAPGTELGKWLGLAYGP